MRVLRHYAALRLGSCLCFYAALRLTLCFSIAAHTAGGVAGMASSSHPMASVIALISAAGAAIAPASPQPLMPSGLPGQTVIVVLTVKDGRLSARGMV